MYIAESIEKVLMYIDANQTVYNNYYYLFDLRSTMCAFALTWYVTLWSVFFY